jgi:cobalt-zinc-cadmium resistance protein CzcA
MRAFNLTLAADHRAIGASNSNVGGRTISLGEQSVNVRGLGVLTSVKDMDNIVLTQQGGLPVLLSDFARTRSASGRGSAWPGATTSPTWSTASC